MKLIPTVGSASCVVSMLKGGSALKTSATKTDGMLLLTCWTGGCGKDTPKNTALAKFPAPNLPFGGCSGSTLQQRKMRKMMKLWMKPALLANLKPLQKAGLHAPGDILLRGSVVTQVSRKELVRLKF